MKPIENRLEHLQKGAISSRPGSTVESNLGSAVGSILGSTLGTLLDEVQCSVQAIVDGDILFDLSSLVLGEHLQLASATADRRSPVAVVEMRQIVASSFGLRAGKLEEG